MADFATFYAESGSFAERVRDFRLERKMTQIEWALAIGVTVAAVRRWEVGTAQPSVDEANRLVAMGLHVEPAETNAGSRARLGALSPGDRADQARSYREAGRRELDFSGTTSEIVPAPYVLNGPADQLVFHEELIRLQIVPGEPPSIATNELLSRLSLVAEVDGKPTSQALLERPRTTATAWNSNYGSHGWHRYVGRFPPHLVRALLNHFQASAHDVVLDPFAGSGTTSVECRLLGIPSVGVEISPLSALIARTKAHFPAASGRVLDLAGSLEEFYRATWSDVIGAHKGSVPDHPTILQRPGNLIHAFPNYERWLTRDALLGTSLIVEYAAQVEPPMRDLLLVALSAKMRSIGNVDVDVVRAEYRKEPRENVDVLRLVRAQLTKMADSIRAMQKSHPALATVTETELIEGNILDADFEPGSIAHVVTSPPYGIESISYFRTHLLSFRCLAPFLNADPYETGAGVIGSEYLDRIEPAAAEFTHAAASSTFEQFFGRDLVAGDPKLVKRVPMMMRFFDDMGVLIARLSTWMRPGGSVGFVIGNKRLGGEVIPANQIVAELFDAHGFDLHESLEHKLKTNNSNSQVPWQERVIQNEYILILSKR